jgi:hypothetical protein
MTEVCEVWSGGELTALVLGTTGVAAAAFLGDSGRLNVLAADASPYAAAVGSW